MTNGRIRRACPLPRSYGPCGEPTAFARLGALLLERRAAREALAKLRREAREKDELYERRRAHEWRQSSQGWDANGSPVLEYPPAPRRADDGMRRPSRGVLLGMLPMLALMACNTGERGPRR